MEVFAGAKYPQKSPNISALIQKKILNWSQRGRKFEVFSNYQVGTIKINILEDFFQEI